MSGEGHQDWVAGADVNPKVIETPSTMNPLNDPGGADVISSKI